MRKFATASIGIDPDGRATYTANAAAYSKELLALNEELKQQAAALPPESRKNRHQPRRAALLCAGVWLHHRREPACSAEK